MPPGKFEKNKAFWGYARGGYRNLHLLLAANLCSTSLLPMDEDDLKWVTY